LIFQLASHSNHIIIIFGTHKTASFDIKTLAKVVVVVNCGDLSMVGGIFS
jgi:hypothetical protein